MRRLLAGLAIMACGAPAAVGVAVADDAPLQAAGRAAEQVTFEGKLRVRWFDGAVQRSDLLTVQGANGSVVVRGGTAAMASLHQRLVEHAGGAWDLLWPSDQMAAGRPDPDLKYQIAPAAPTTVSGRPANVVEVRQGGALLERLALDQASGLLLRREQYEDLGGPPSRTIEFETVTIGGATPALDPPRTVVNASPDVVAKSKAAPALDGGYQRIGTYKRSGVTQLLYSDGLYDLSVFEQAGRLDKSHLPNGSKIELANSRGIRYAWPGGHVVVWATSGMVYTAVSDAPLDQVLAAVRSMPLTSAPASLLRRLRQVCRALIQPLS